MSDEVLAPILALVILALMFLWVPTLDICNDRCQMLLRGRRRAEPEAGEKAPADIREAA